MNKYEKWYGALIEKRRKNPLIKDKSNPKYVYCETHHILPKCLGGTNTNDNLINLTAREHYVAHLLLVKIYQKKNDKNAYIKMLSALIYMLCSSSKLKNNERIFRFNSRNYELKRKEFGKYISEYLKNIPLEKKKEISSKYSGEKHWDVCGEKNPMYGHSCVEFMTDEEIEKWHKNMSLSRIGKRNPFYGKHHSEESKNKFRKSFNEFIKRNGGHGCLYGKKLSEEVRKRMSIQRKGKSFSKAALKKFNITRIYKHYGNKYDLSEFNFDKYIEMNELNKCKYRREYFSSHKL